MSNGEEKHSHIDPALLFQRLVTVARRSEKDESSYFAYELCSHPLSLFDNNCLPRNADKHELAKAIALLAKYDPLKVEVENHGEQVQRVLDGGWLIHQIPCPKNETKFNKLKE